jgi:hypothetical protein
MSYKKKRIFIKWIGVFVDLLLIPIKYMANMEDALPWVF